MQDEELLREQPMEGTQDDTDVSPDDMRGITQEEIAEKIIQLEISEPEFKKQLTDLMNGIGVDPTPFLAMKPTREFMLGKTDPFDEYEIEGDFESALILADMHPAFYSTAMMLYLMGINRLALTRSRRGFQQQMLRTYIGVQKREDLQQNKPRWAVPLGARGQQR